MQLSRLAGSVLRFGFLLTLALSALFAPAIHAQDASAIVGVVQDATGAVIPGAQVVLTNPSKGLKYTAVTSPTGSYQINNAAPGPGYRLTVSHAGFSDLSIDAIYLPVGSTRTQNAKLQAGSDVKIEVSAGSQGVTLNTTDATVGNNVVVSTLNELPIYDRTNGITTLFDQEPGEANGSTAGARVDQNSVTLDGLDVNDIAAGTTFAVVGTAPLDSVQEFRGTVAGFGAGSGEGGGGQFSLVTKGGTNHFHGNINEYHRDTSLVANDYFSNLSGVARSPLIQNQFGGNIGGPILKDKLFFFFDFADSRIIANSLQTRTVPLPNFTAGQVGYINNGPGCNDGSRANTQATCITYLTKSQVAGLDPSSIGDNASVAALTSGRYPGPNDLTLGDGINTGGFRFNAPNDNFQMTYVSRVDYVINSKMSLYGRGTVTRQNAVETANAFPGDPSTNPFVDRSYAYVVGFNQQIGSNKTNQIIYGETKQNVAFPDLYDPQGVYNPIFFSGTTQLLSSPYNAPASQSRIIPIPLFTDNFTWERGKHNLSFGGTTKWIHTHNANGGDYNNVYVGLGGETQSLNASLRPSDIFQTQTGTSYVDYDEGFTSQLGRVGQIEGTFNFDANGNVQQQGTGSRRQYRYYQTELYAADSWKIMPHLTLSYGLDYQLFSVPYEINGEESVPNTTFDKYIAARVAQSAAGISGNTAVPFISYELGGKANNGAPIYQPQHDNFAPRFGFSYNPSWSSKTVFNGSMGLVYDRTIVQAILAEQDAYSYLFQQPSSVPFGAATDPVGSVTNCINTSCPANSPNSPRLGGPVALTTYNPPPSTSTTPFTPFVSGGVPYGLANGGEFNISVDPKLKTPYSLMPTFGVQHEFHGGFIAKVNYVGRFGRRLLAQADANQIIDFADPSSTQLLSTAFGNITKALRAGANSANLPAQPWFENQLPAGIGVANGYPNNTSFLADNINSLVLKGDFADSVQALAGAGLIQPNVGMGSQFSENTFFTNKGFSTYQGLLATLTKNLSHGLKFDLNYTYAHSIDNVSLVANSEAFTGYGFVCDVLRPRECRGESDFDIKHYVTADFTYNLPYGRGQTFGANIPWYLNEVLGGWAISGLTSAHSGQAYSTVSSAFVASYSNDAPAILVGNKSALTHNVHKSNGAVYLYKNPAAAAAAFTGPVGFQIGSRNGLRGPRYFNQDLGLAKLFPLYPAKDVNLKFRADAYNVLNHESFNSPGTLTNYDDVTQTGNFGELTSSASSFRILQVSLRLEF